MITNIVVIQILVVFNKKCSTDEISVDICQIIKNYGCPVALATKSWTS